MRRKPLRQLDRRFIGMEPAQVGARITSPIHRGKTMKRILLAASLLGLFGMSVPAEASSPQVPVQTVGWYGYGYRPWGGYYAPYGGYGYYRPYGYYGGWGGYYRPYGYGGYYGGWGPRVGIGVGVY
jgi:hypothetical protein